MQFVNDLGNLSRITDAKTRSISSENPTGAPGAGGACPLEKGYSANAARDLGLGWKVNPCTAVPSRSVYTLAEIDGPGCITQIWCTPTGAFRRWILRIYWEGSDVPSVECPLGDFFCNGWNVYAHVSSLAVCVNPGRAFCCYWQMPFRKHCRITIENQSDKDEVFFYQINYELRDVPEDAGYFHARFHRDNPLPYKTVHTVLDGAEGRGQYVGTYIAWGSNNCGWWGEGEMKFYMDGDGEFPTICGTGTEDYFCGAYNFENQANHQYEIYTTPYAGLCQVIRPDGLYASQTRFGMYRWHVTDPIRFEKSLRVTIQALGWRYGGRYLPLQDDISSVAFWYQDRPATSAPPFPDRDALEII
jgi:hypothetical protein